MKFFILFFVLLSGVFLAQKERRGKSVPPQSDTLVVNAGKSDSITIYKPTIKDYQFFNQNRHRQIIDTTFSQDKLFIFTQWNNRDNFGRMSFANIGSGYNPLVYQINQEDQLSVLPTNKSFGILGIQDIVYYDVKTPTTTFVYHNGMQNGSALQSTYTQNIGRNFNFSIQYMGLRSQGFFNNSLASNNNTIFTAHYTSKNSKYRAMGHYIHQNVQNQENGGIIDVDNYLSDDDTNNIRETIITNLQGSNSRLAYRRYFFTHDFSPFNPQKYPFKLRHTIFHQANKYYYGDPAAQSFYTNNTNPLMAGFPFLTGKYSKNLSNQFSLVWDKEKFKLQAGIRHQWLKLGVEDGVTINNIVIPNQLDENRIGVVGDLEILFQEKINLQSHFEASRGKTFGNFLKSRNQINFQPWKSYFVNAFVNYQSTTPSFNYHINTSPYQNFNYFNTNFKNQNILEIGGKIGIPYFKTELFSQYYRIENFTYLDQNALPQQSSIAVNVSQIGGDATISYRKFHLNSRILFQKMLNNPSLFPTPDVVARANIFYQSKVFKNAAEIQTGIKACYFSSFASRDFFPILNEFILPETNSQIIGGKPVIDIYFNMKVKRMFFFVEAQHITTTFTRNQVFSAPNHPFHDFRLNLGIVWYLIN